MRVTKWIAPGAAIAALATGCGSGSTPKGCDLGKAGPAAVGSAAEAYKVNPDLISVVASHPSYVTFERVTVPVQVGDTRAFVDLPCRNGKFGPGTVHT